MVVGILLNTKLNPNETDENDNSATAAVPSESSLNGAKKLLAAGVDINQTDEKGNTLLHRAVKDKNVELVRALVAQGIDLAVENQDKKTALSLAKALARGETKTKLTTLLKEE